MGAHNAVRNTESNRLSVNVGSFSVTTNLDSLLVARHIFTNNSSTPMTLKQVTAIATAVSASGTVDVVKCTSGQAPSSGTSMLLTVISTATAGGFVANTPTVRSEVAGTLSATAANRVLNPGESLAVVAAGSQAGMTGGTLTCWF